MNEPTITTTDINEACFYEERLCKLEYMSIKDGKLALTFSHLCIKGFQLVYRKGNYTPHLFYFEYLFENIMKFLRSDKNTFGRVSRPKGGAA